MKLRADAIFASVSSPDYLRSADMTEVMNVPSMDEIGLSPRKDGLSYQVRLLEHFRALLASCKLPIESVRIR